MKARCPHGGRWCDPCLACDKSVPGPLDWNLALHMAAMCDPKFEQALIAANACAWAQSVEVYGPSTAETLLRDPWWGSLHTLERAGIRLNPESVTVELNTPLEIALNAARLQANRGKPEPWVVLMPEAQVRAISRDERLKPFGAIVSATLGPPNTVDEVKLRILAGVVLIRRADVGPIPCPKCGGPVGAALDPGSECYECLCRETDALLAEAGG